jgi:hypothetical protein
MALAPFSPRVGKIFGAMNRRLFNAAGLAWSSGIIQAATHQSGSGQQNLRPQTAPVLRVGLARAVKTLAEASRVAVPGITIEVDAGEYVADVATWERDDVSIRSIGGRVRLLANGAAAEGKGIWVVRANRMRVEGFDFEGAAVPSRNGAGIRLENGSLHVKDCRFLRNEMGLLTNNDPATVLEVENSEFAYNQRPDGHNHNLYAGRIARLSVVGSYFHHARIGHLLKTRAAVKQIFYNRLTDEPGGTASYELEFPNGGVAHVVGNIIAQGPQTDNVHLISFGAEGYKWQRNAIYLAHNTLVNLLPRGGVFLRVAPEASAVLALNNLLLGPGTLEAAGPGEYRNNLAALPEDFVLAASFDYRLAAGSRLKGRAVDAGSAAGESLRPLREYVHPRATRSLAGPAHNPGALQSTASP